MKKKLSKHKQNCEHCVSEWNKYTNNYKQVFIDIYYEDLPLE